MRYGISRETPFGCPRSLKDDLDAGDCVGRIGHFSPVRNFELARMLALQKQTAGPRGLRLPVRVAGPVLCSSGRVAGSAAVGHDTRIPVGGKRAVGIE